MGARSRARRIAPARRARVTPAAYSRDVTAIRGFAYAPRTEKHRLRDAAPGEVVANAERGPPWFVVDHALTTVIVTSWPGRLLAVEVPDAVTANDLRRAQQPGLRPDAGYTRAIAVRVLEELPAWTLFGAHGDSVVEVIEAAQRLTVTTAGTLAAAIDPGAAHAYAAAWDAWLGAEGIKATYPLSAEIHNKIALSFSSLAFLLISIPLGVTTKRSEKSISFGISLALMTLYWLLLIGGKSLAACRQTLAIAAGLDGGRAALGVDGQHAVHAFDVEDPR